LAARRPELFSRILAVSMPGKVPAITQEAFKWFLHRGPYDAIKASGLHKRLDWRNRELVSTNKHTLEQIVANFTEMNYADNVPAVQCPVHFVVGRFDPVAPVKYVEQMHRALPDSTFTVLEWAGHNCMDSQPQLFNSWMMEKIRN
jgi:pimeloyl-ACP methyl ester carboxylesterase